ncbi:MAG: 5-(carboxyamino)imidazole ribonucleotide mutase [Thermoplasmata archaeon]
MELLIILGSKSDMGIAEKAMKVLDELGVDYGINIASAHRTPERVKELVAGSDAKVFIAIAGLSAALPGVIASHTLKPVIGVPVSGKLNMDSILSVLQMPSGIPVGAVGLDNGKNAALLAAEILALGNKELEGKLSGYRKKMEDKISKDAEDLKSK